MTIFRRWLADLIYPEGKFKRDRLGDYINANFVALDVARQPGPVRVGA